MKVIIGGRQSGKTARLLAWMHEAPEGEHRVCVTFSDMEAMRLLRENPDLESWQFVGTGEVRAGAWSGVLRGRGGHIVLGYDNADLALQQMVPFELGVITVTGAPDSLDAAWADAEAAAADLFGEPTYIAVAGPEPWPDSSSSTYRAECGLDIAVRGHPTPAAALRALRVALGAKLRATLVL